MKDYEQFDVRLIDLVEPLVGHLLTLDIGGESVKARVVDVHPGAARLKVVPANTKE
jgi:hypothetical protein